MVVALTGRDVVKGMIGCCIGGLFACIGLSPFDSRPRFTFDIVNLYGGIPLIAFLVGLFAVTEVVKYAESVRNPLRVEIQSNVKIRGFGFSLREFFEHLPNAIRSSLIGIGIGILPGIGGGEAGMLAYAVAKNVSKHPEKFGTGVPEGVVASESANNSCIGGAMIPLLSLGIPGDGATAVLLREPLETHVFKCAIFKAPQFLKNRHPQGNLV